MKKLFLVIICVIFTTFCFSEESLPDGLVLESFSKEDFNLFTLAPQKEDDASPAMEVIENLPSAVVAGCVNAISGDFFDSCTDLIVPGPEPIVVQRSYNSAEKKWHFRHTPLLKVGPSDGGHHIYAGYQDDSGSGMPFEAHIGDRLEKGIKICSMSLDEKKAVKSGMTNCCGVEISGQTHWNSSKILFVRKNDEKMYLLRHGTGVDRLFSRIKRYGDHHRPGAPFGKFHLKKEIHPNGNTLNYSYDKHDDLIKITCKNSQKEALSSLKIEYDYSGQRWSSFCGSVYYRFDDDLLYSTTPSHGSGVKFVYDKSGRLNRKILPEGRSLSIEYHNGKVSTLLSPVGTGEFPIKTHTFSYERKGCRKVTKVRDAKGILTEYQHHNKRLLSIIHHFEKGTITENFAWHANGNLLKRDYILGKTRIFSKQLAYDQYHNVTQEELIGNLTGKEKQDSYVKHFKASDDGLNLPLEENDGRKCIHFTYYPKSNLLESRKTIADGAFVKEEFFTYDKNGVLISERWTEGGLEHLKIIIPTTDAPIGLPEIIEEYYCHEDKQLLIKKTCNQYSLQGKLIQQMHYGSDDALAYTLFWEYDAAGNLLSETNALGQKTEFEYDKLGNKTFEKHPSGFCKKFSYDFANRLIQEEEIIENERLVTSHRYNVLGQKTTTIDIFGNETHFTYNALGRLIQKELPPVNGIVRVERMEYDAIGNLICRTDAKGCATQKKCTIRGKPYKTIYPDGSVEEKEYSLDGRLIKEVAKNGTVTCYTHDGLDNLIKTEVLDANGSLKVKTANYNAHLLLSETDELGVDTTYTYDAMGRVATKQREDRCIRYEYDALGREIKVIEEDRVTCKEYDLLDRVIEERIEKDGILYQKEQFVYGFAEKPTHHIQWTHDGIATTFTEYNVQGKPILIEDALGHKTHITYDYSFFHEGRFVLQTTKTDPLGNQEIKLIDGDIEVATIRKNPFETVQKETYEYDLNLNRTKIHSHVYAKGEYLRTVTTAWDYDVMGQEVRCIEAEGTEEQKCTYTTYHLGQKQSVLTPNGVTLDYTYDPLGRVATCKASDETVHYTYFYDAKDQLVKVHDHAQNIYERLQYDHHGNLTRETLANGCILNYAYDQLDRLVTLTLPDASKVNYSYNPVCLTSIQRNDYTHTYSDFDLAVNPAQETLISGDTLTKEYDRLQRAFFVKTPSFQETLSYDAAGNPIRQLLQDPKGALERNFTYDSLYQLTSESGDTPHTYEHDSLYNRIAKDESPYTLNNLNQLLSENEQHYSYDPNGNLVQKQDVRYSYDALGRLKGIQNGDCSISYTYDSSHRRMSKTIDDKTTLYFYQGQNEIGAITDGALQELRVLGLGKGAEIGAAVLYELSGKTYLPLHDSCGNVRVLLDTDGNTVDSCRYTAFGETDNPAFLSPWKFSSKRFDAESGFYYFGRRYYDPIVGRWATPDPAGFIDGVNLYAYVHNHPLAYVDPDGRFLMFLVPIAISMALDYAVPVAAAALQEYAGGAIAAAVITGMAQGYNGSIFETSALGASDPSLFIAEKIGTGIGALLSLNPGKITCNLTGKAAKVAAQTLATKEVTAVASASAWKRATSWFSNTARQATLQQTKAVQTVCNAQGTSQAAAKRFGREASNYVNLACPERTRHILHGDHGLGGHMFPGKIDKTEFPKMWSSDKIMHYVSDIATDPKTSWTAQQGSLGKALTSTGKPMRCVGYGEREGVNIKVVLEPHINKIITAFPKL